MIEKNELRIGNWVSRSETMENKEFATIEEIKRFGNITLLEDNEDIGETFWESHLSCVHPIPLTGEMLDLLKSKMLDIIFTKSDTLPSWTSYSFFSRIRLEDNSKHWSYTSGHTFLGHFKYVHELQNLVFALEKIELEFNF